MGSVPDLAGTDCTRTDDRLAAEGFRIASRGRIGNVASMSMDPKSSARANCFSRSPA